MMQAIQFLSNPAWQRLALTLLHFVWQGLAVAVLAAAGVRLLKLRPGPPRHAAFLLALVVMAACPVVTFCLVSAPVPMERPADPHAPESAARLTDERQPPADTPWASPNTVEPAAPADEPVVIAPTPPAQAGDLESPAKLESSRELLSRYLSAGLPWVAATWLLGVVVLSARLLLGVAGTYRWRRRLESLPRHLAEAIAALSERMGLAGFARVFISRFAAQPMVVGYLRPMVLLPAAMLTNLPPEMLEAVIAHELAHIRRLDVWVNLFQRMMETVLFYHPAVWWLSGQVRSQRELCCDELAVAATGQRLTYASALERAYRGALSAAQPVLAAGLGAQKRTVLARVRHVLGLVPSPSGSRWWLAGALALLSVLALAIGMGVSSAAGKAPSPERKAEVATPPATQPARKEEATAARIAELIALLGSDHHKQREKAQQALVQIGIPAIPALHAAASGKDPERAARAKAAIAEVEKQVWGEPVDGLQVRLRALWSVWKIGQTPTLPVDLRNRGTGVVPYGDLHQRSCRIEVDGRWYGWGAGYKGVIMGPGVGPGQDRNEAWKIELVGTWKEIVPTKRWPDGAATGKQLRLIPGRHTIRFQFYRGRRVRVRPISNRVQIQVLAPAPTPPATQPAGKRVGSTGPSFDSLTARIMGGFWWYEWAITGEGDVRFRSSRPGYTSKFRLKAEDLRRLNGLLEKTAWLTARAAPTSAPAAHTGTTWAVVAAMDPVFKIVLVRSGKERRAHFWLPSYRPSIPGPYGPLVGLLLGLHHQEGLLQGLKQDSVPAQLAVCKAIIGDPAKEEGVVGPAALLDPDRIVAELTKLRKASPNEQVRRLAGKALERIAQSGSRATPPGTLPAAAQAPGRPAAAAGFAAAVERTVYVVGQHADSFLDLEPGKLLALPALDAPDDPTMSAEANRRRQRSQRARAAGADVMCHPYPKRYGGKVFGLLGLDMAVVRADTKAWDFTPAQATKVLGGRDIYAENEMLTAPGKFPATFLVETRGGRIGVVQVLGFTDRPRGVKLRYKLAPASVARPPPGPLWITLAPSEETVHSLKGLKVLAEARNLDQAAARTGRWEIRMADNKKRVARIAYNWDMRREQFLPDGKRILGGTTRRARCGLSSTQLRWIGDLGDGGYVLGWYVAGKRCSNVARFRIRKDYDPKTEPLLALAEIAPGPNQSLPMLILRARRHAETDPAPMASAVAFAALNVNGKDRHVEVMTWAGGDAPLPVGKSYSYLLDLSRYTWDPRARKKLPPLQPGRKHVIVAKVGKQQSNRITLRDDRGPGRAWDLATGGLTPVPAPRVVLTGAVIAWDGKPAAGYEVNLVRADKRSHRYRERSGAKGRYALRSIPAGRYDVLANPPGKGQPGLVVRGVKLDPAKTTRLDLSLEKKFLFAGRVTYPDGTPAWRVEVMATWRSPDGRAEYLDFATTDGQGRYTLGAPYPEASYVGIGGVGPQPKPHRRVKAGRMDVDFVVAKPKRPPATQPRGK